MAVTNSADSSFWDDLSQLLGKSAAGAGGARAQEGNYLNSRDAVAARLYDIAQTTRQQAATNNLAADKFKAGLPSQGASEAVRGALIQNVQPFTLDPGTSHMTRMSFSGGETPAVLTPEARAAGAALAKHGTSLLNDPNSAYTQTPGSGVGGTSFLPTPGLSPQPTAGFWENAAGVGSVASGLLGALAKAAGSGGGGGSAGNLLKSLFGGGGGMPSTISGTANPELPGTAEPDWWNLMPGANDNPFPVPSDSGGSASGVAYGPDGQPLPQGPGGNALEDPNAVIPDWWNQLPQDTGDGGGGF